MKPPAHGGPIPLPTPSTLEYFADLEATIAAHRRWEQRRAARRRTLRWLAPWPLASVAGPTDFICELCRKANRERTTHPGQMHLPGICDCKCRDA